VLGHGLLLGQGLERVRVVKVELGDVPDVLGAETLAPDPIN